MIYIVVPSMGVQARDGRMCGVPARTTYEVHYIMYVEPEILRYSWILLAESRWEDEDGRVV